MDLYDYCAQNSIRIVYCNLPCKIKGFCLKDEDCYIIAINARHSTSVQEKTVRHELFHITHGHLQMDKRFRNECEYEAKRSTANI